MRCIALILAGTSLLLPGTAQQQRGTKAPTTETQRALKSVRGFRRLKVPGDEVEQNVRRLTKEMRWHKTLGAALASGRRQSKPVVWIQALGDLDGFL